MPVRIDELHTTVDVVGPRGLLAPEVLEQVIAAVLAALDERERGRRTQAAEVDTRSVVDQQRGGRD